MYTKDTERVLVKINIFWQSN